MSQQGQRIFAAGRTEIDNGKFIESELDVTDSVAAGLWLVSPHNHDDRTFTLTYACETPEAAAMKAAKQTKMEHRRLPQTWQVFPLLPGITAIKVQDRFGNTSDLLAFFADQWIEVKL